MSGEPAAAAESAVQALRWQRLPIDADGFAGFGQRWDALASRLCPGDPGCSARAVIALLAGFGTGAQQLCIGSDAAGTVVAMLIVEPLAGRVWQSMRAPGLPLSPLLVTPGSDIGAIWQCLPKGIVEIVLRGADDRRDGLVTAQLGRPHCNWRGRQLWVDLQGSFDDYWRRRAGPLQRAVDKARQNIDRDRDDDEAIRFCRLVDRAGINAALQRLHSGSTVDEKGSAGADAIDRRAALQRALAADGGSAVEIHEIWAGRRWLASQLLLLGQRTIVTIAAADASSAGTADAPGAAASAVGLLLQGQVLRECFSHHAGKMLLLAATGAGEPLGWANGQAPTHDVRLYRRPDGAALQFRVALPYRADARSGRGRQSVPARGLRAESCSPEEAPADVLALLAKAETDSMQYGADWLLNFCRQVRLPGRQPRLQVLRRDGEPVAVLPLFIGEPGGPASGRIEALANYYTAAYAPVLAAGVQAADLAWLLTDMLRRHPGTASLRFAPLDTASREFTLLRDALTFAGLPAFPFFCFGNWYQRFDGMTAARYLASRGGRLRSTIKRKSGRFAAEGGRIEIVSDPQQLAPALAAFQQVYSRSWKVPEPYPQFMPELIATCARRGWLRLGVAWLGDQPVAAQLWIVANGKVDIYKLAYDEAYTRLSGGTLLSAAMMEHVFNNDGVREIDYLIGDDAYKRDWLDCRRERWGLIAYNPRTARGIASAASEAIKRGIKLALAIWRDAQSGVVARPVTASANSSPLRPRTVDHTPN